MRTDCTNGAQERGESVDVDPFVLRNIGACVNGVRFACADAVDVVGKDVRVIHAVLQVSCDG